MKKILLFLYPFFFAIYPILALRNYNLDYVDPASLIRPILLSLLLTGIIWCLLWLVTKSPQKSGAITTIIMVAFFSYGHIYNQIESGLGYPIRHRYLVIIFGLLILLLSAWIVLRVKRLDSLNDFLIITGTALFVFALYQSASHDIAAAQAAARARQLNQQITETPADGMQKPDIYLILLDAHTGQDVLRKELNYDSTAFIQQLKKMGFYVAECAQSNYPATKLSVTATFFGKYHEDPILYPVYSSMTIETVRALGYKVITFENRSNGHFDIGEDMRLSRNTMALGRIDLTGGLSEFDAMLLQTSFFRLFYDMPQLIPGLDEQVVQREEYSEHFEQTHYILEELTRLPEMTGPKFVFAHILVPHPPFIFTPEGKYNWFTDPKKGYLSNIEFIDGEITQVVSQIIAKSKIPPVIIIMGDHGPAGIPVTPQMRMSILNAYFVNDQAKQDLYETITPINTFRVIFNNYFGTNYPLLEDKSYYSYGMKQFTNDRLVPNTCEVGP